MSWNIERIVSGGQTGMELTVLNFAIVRASYEYGSGSSFC